MAQFLWKTDEDKSTKKRRIEAEGPIALSISILLAIERREERLRFKGGLSKQEIEIRESVKKLQSKLKAYGNLPISGIRDIPEKLESLKQELLAIDPNYFRDLKADFFVKK
jgi:hypothetical protein